MYSSVPAVMGEETFEGSFLPYLAWKRKTCAFTNVKNQVNGPWLCPAEGFLLAKFF